MGPDDEGVERPVPDEAKQHADAVGDVGRKAAEEAVVPGSVAQLRRQQVDGGDDDDRADYGAELELGEALADPAVLRTPAEGPALVQVELGDDSDLHCDDGRDEQADVLVCKEAEVGPGVPVGQDEVENRGVVEEPEESGVDQEADATDDEELDQRSGQVEAVGEASQACVAAFHFVAGVVQHVHSV